MENNCAIINDLMPLCAEKIASEQSLTLVEKHISGCEQCRATYEEMKNAAEKAGISEAGGTETGSAAAAPLKKVRQKLRRGRAKTILVCALTVALVMVSVFSSLTARRYVPYSEDLITVEELPDGTLEVVIAGGSDYDMVRCWTSDQPAEGEAPDCVYFEVWDTRLDAITRKNSDFENAELVYLKGVNAVDYCDFANDGERIRIYGEQHNGGAIVLERLVLGYFIVLSMLAAVVSGICWLLLRKRRAGKVMSYIFFIPVSYLLGHLPIMGFSTLSVNADVDFCFILLAAAAVYTIIAVIRKKETVI